MKNKHFFKKLQTVILAAVIAFTSIPVNTFATEVTEINVEDAVNLPEDNNFADNDLEVSANDLSSDENADLDSDLVTEDSFFGFKLNPVSKDETSRQIEELKENSSVPVIDLSEKNENDLDADCFSGNYVSNEDISNMTFAAKYDPRSLGLVTSVKNQGQWGLCWDYAGLSTLESCLIKTGYANSSIDLSELHSAYATYKYESNIADTMTFTKYCNLGGSVVMSFMTMNNGYGPVLESTVPWKEPTDDFILSDEVLNSHIYELQKYYTAKFGSSKNNINQIKYLISNYGATSICLYMYYTNGWGFKEAGSVNGDASFYFPQYTGSANHALSVVGWDDNYPATNFGVTAPGNGAWLVKNSYGSGDTRLGSGYMWVSYYDGSIEDIYGISPVFIKNGSLTTNITAVADKTEVYTEDKVTITATKTPADSIGDIEVNDNQIKLVSKNNGVYTFEYTPVFGSYYKYREDNYSLKKELTFKATLQTTYGSEYKDIDIPITVLSKPIVTLKETTKSLKIGENYQLSPTVKGNIPDGFTESFSYVSSDPNVAYVNNKGKIIVKGYGSADITVTDEKGYAKPAVIKVTGYYDYKSLASLTGDRLNLTITNTYYSFCQSISPVFLEDESLYIDPSDYTITIDSSGSNLYVFGNTLYYSAYTGMKKTQSFNLTLTYKGIYTNGKAVSKKIPVTITAEDWVVNAMNYTPTPAPSNNPVIPNPSNGNGNGNGTNGNENVTNPNPNNTTPSVKPVTVKKTTCSAKNRKGKLKITWKKKSGINGYQVQYSTNKKFKNAKTKTIKNAKTTSKTYKAIKKGKKHYVRVRTYKIVNGRKYYSSWSKVKSAVVK